MLLFSSFLIAADDFGLGQLAAEPAQVTFEVTQHQELLTEVHYNW